MTTDEKLINDLSKTSLALDEFQTLVSGLTEKIKHCDEIYEKIFALKNEIILQQKKIEESFKEKQSYLEQLKKTFENAFSAVPASKSQATSTYSDIKLNEMSGRIDELESFIQQQLKKFNSTIDNMDRTIDGIETMVASIPAINDDEEYTEDDTEESKASPEEIKDVLYDAFDIQKKEAPAQWPTGAKFFNLQRIKDVSYTKPYGIEFSDCYIKVEHWKQLITEAFQYFHQFCEPAFDVQDISEMNYQDGYEHYYFVKGNLESDYKSFMYIPEEDISIRYGGAKLTIKEIECLCEYFDYPKEEVKIIYHD